MLPANHKDEAMAPFARHASGQVKAVLFVALAGAVAAAVLFVQADAPASYAGTAGGGLRAVGSQFWHQDVAGVEGVAAASDLFGRTLASGDFNGDGALDLAIGAFGEAVDSIPTAGAVNVLYGSPAGLTAVDNQIWHQNVPDVEDAAEGGDGFGKSVAAGDFNGDGRDDLAVGVPGEAIDGVASAGAVNVLYGSPAGLTAAGDQIWHQNVADVEGTAGAGDSFGWAVAAGDFNGDGEDDLAVGVPLEAIASIASAGAVNVLYGSASGLTAAGDQIWHQDVPDLEGAAATNDAFGWAVAAGDFNGDGQDDLAAGVPRDVITGIAGAGAVNVLYGSPAGLTAAGNQIWHQDIADVDGAAETGDNFGTSVASGDFNGDGDDDLAAGAPFEAVGSVVAAGAVNVLYGSAAGLAAANDQIWHQDVPDVEGAAEGPDHFGFSAGSGDFNGNGEDDLAIGAPGEAFGGVPREGAVNVLYGSSTGLTAAGDQIWHQGVAGVEGTTEEDGKFGYAVAAGDFNDDGEDDLAIGAFGEAIGGQPLAGAVNVLYGSPPPAAMPTITSTPVPGATSTATQPPSSTPTLPARGAGDADCSGTVTAIDAALILQFGAGLLDSLPCPDAADVNEDGTFTAVDATLILQFVAGLIGSLPP